MCCALSSPPCFYLPVRTLHSAHCFRTCYSPNDISAILWEEEKKIQLCCTCMRWVYKHSALRGCCSRFSLPAGTHRRAEMDQKFVTWSEPGEGLDRDGVFVTTRSLPSSAYQSGSSTCNSPLTDFPIEYDPYQNLGESSCPEHGSSQQVCFPGPDGFKAILNSMADAGEQKCPAHCITLRNSKRPRVRWSGSSDRAGYISAFSIPSSHRRYNPLVTRLPPSAFFFRSSFLA